MATKARRRAGRTAAAPGGRNRIGGGLEQSEAERIRVHAVVETIRHMNDAGGAIGDWWSDITCNRDDGETARKLARKLGVPFMLLMMMNDGPQAPTPPELAEWMEWLERGGRAIVPEFTAEGWEG